MEDGGEEDVDIEDFIMMRSALLGLDQLDFYQKVAADVDQSHTFDIDDLYEFRNILLGKSEIAKADAWTFVPQMYNVNSADNDLDISQSIPYYEYGEGFNFYGVKTGDLTGASMIQTDEGNSDDDIVSFRVDIYNDEVVIISNQTFTTDAIQLDLHSSPYDMGMESKFVALKETKNGFRYLNLNTSHEIQKDQVLFKYKTNSNSNSAINELVKNAKIYLKGSSQNVAVSWQINDRREMEVEIPGVVDLHVYPIPMQDRLTIDGSDITNIALYNLTGEQIQIETMIFGNGANITFDNALASGIYLLKVTTSADEKIIKVMK